VLSAVLDGYDNARLTANLVRTASQATAVGASYSGVARGPVLFTLEGSPANGVTTEQLEACCAPRSSASPVKASPSRNCSG
jgi:zinc protease